MSAEVMKPPTIPVAVLVITFNEEANISACLESLRACDQIVVVDSGSTDRTQALAQDAGATVIEHPFSGFAHQKNWAIASVSWRHDWLLFLDADERLTPSLEVAISEAVGARGGVDGFYVNRRFHFLGHTFRHSGLSSNWHLRLVRRNLAHFEDRAVDERLVPPKTTARLCGELYHEDRRGLAAWIARHNEYSDLDSALRLNGEDSGGLNITARQAVANPALRRRWIKQRVWPHIPGKPAAIFVYMFVVRAGFLDGKAGWRYAWLRSFYEFITEIKVAERRQDDNLPPTAMNRKQPDTRVL